MIDLTDDLDEDDDDDFIAISVSGASSSSTAPASTISNDSAGRSKINLDSSSLAIMSTATSRQDTSGVSLQDQNTKREAEEEMNKIDHELKRLYEEREALDLRINELNHKRESCASIVLSLKQKRVQTVSNMTKNKQIMSINDWEKENFTHSRQLRSTLKSVFGHGDFRPYQLRVMNATLAGIDCFVVMPTGSGKSLLYQLPAVLQSGSLTLVVSPLLSLSADQVMNLADKSIQSGMLCSDTSKEQSKTIFQYIDSDQLCLLFVTPEKILKSKTLMNKLEKVYKRSKLARIVIDEAHCCSTMGHDFRSDYQKLFILRRQFPAVPILAVTATATVHVEKEVQKVLLGKNSSPHDWLVFRTSFNRPNLMYSVISKPEKTSDFFNLLIETITSKFPGQTGIVYCFARKDCESTAIALIEAGISSASYHAYSPDKTRVHQAWKCGQIHVVCATAAFGMGIDKPDVRFVIHQSIPKNMEAYCQESGRAGRDNERAECILFYRRADVPKVSCLVAESRDGDEKLMSVAKYAEQSQFCRRKIMAESFGEQFSFDASRMCNSMCDNCVKAADTVVKLENVNTAARSLFGAFQDILQSSKDGRVTFHQLCDAWRGVGKMKGFVRNQWSGKKAWNKDETEQLIAIMLISRIFRIRWEFTAYSTNSYIAKGPYASLFLSGQYDVTIENVCEKERSTSKNKMSNKRKRSNKRK